MSFVDVPTRTSDAGAGTAGSPSDAGRLSALRKEKGLDTAELARISGLSQDAIVAIESGKAMSTEEADAIAAALNVPVASIRS